MDFPALAAQIPSPQDRFVWDARNLKLRVHIFLSFCFRSILVSFNSFLHNQDTTIRLSFFGFGFFLALDAHPDLCSPRLRG